VREPGTVAGSGGRFSPECAQVRAFGQRTLSPCSPTVTFVVLLTAHAAAAIQKTNLRCEAVLREQNSLFEAALHHLPMGLSMFDSEQRLIMCNSAYRALYDLTDELACKGTSFSDLVLDYVRRAGGSDDGTHLDNARNWIAEHLSKLKLGNKFTETILGLHGAANRRIQAEPRRRSRC
jgi:PAS domain-containing protein